MKKKLLLGFLFLFILGGIYTAYQVISHRPPSGGPGFKLSGKVPNPPSGKISIYKGFWMPCSFLDDSCQSMNDAKLIKETGGNIIGIAPNIKINSKGEVSFFPMDFVEKGISDYAGKYYPKGIRIFISPELDYTEDLNSRSSGEPRKIPAELTVKSGFLDKYDLIIEDLAKLAEKYDLEMFSPMNEPDMKLTTAVSSKWGQAILPKIKKYYSGKVLWKVGKTDQSSGAINFKGYDVIGVDFTVPGGPEAQSLANYPAIVDNIVNFTHSWAKRDGVSQIIFAEFGGWGDAIKFTEEGKVKAHRIVFEQARGKVDGFVVLDPPPDLGDRQLKGSLTLKEISEWFIEKL